MVWPKECYFSGEVTHAHLRRHLIHTYLILINHVTSTYLNPQCKYLHVSIFACSVIVFFKHEA